jgi:hypothetical protein
VRDACAPGERWRRGALLDCYGAGDWHVANMKKVLASAATSDFCGEFGDTAGGAAAAAAAAAAAGGGGYAFLKKQQREP